MKSTKHCKLTCDHAMDAYQIFEYINVDDYVYEYERKSVNGHNNILLPLFILNSLLGGQADATLTNKIGKEITSGNNLKSCVKLLHN